MATTEDDLEEGFAGESQARNRYLFFADRAEEEDKPNVARLFRAAAEAEKVHARNHAEALGMVKDTAENLEDAIEGENYEHTEMYPGFIEDAREEGESQALRSFTWAKKVEVKHESLYKRALEAVRGGEDLEDDKFFVCDKCGYTTEGKVPEVCPVCGAPRKMSKEVK